MRQHDPFETLLHRYRGMLFSLCRRYSRQGALVDDLLQEATVALWRNRSRIPDGLGQAPWIWRTARNAIIDCLRRTPNLQSLPDDYDPPADNSALVAELHERIALLDDPDRTIVSMQLEGYSYQEIGQQLGISEKNVSVRLVRIKEKIRKEWTR